MILIITNKLDLHADAVIHHLKGIGVDFVRFNTEDFLQKTSFFWQLNWPTGDGLFQLPNGQEIPLSQIDSCWYRRPESPILSGELVTQQAKEFAKDESNALLRGFWAYLSSCFWINYPFKIRQAGSKMFNLKLAAEVGFCVPRTLITNKPQEAKKFIYECQGKVVSKALGKGQVEYLEDCYFVYTHKISSQDLDRIDNVAYVPTLFQEYVSKWVEIRVTVVGNKIFSCEIHSQDSEKTLDDWRHYDWDNVKHLVHKLPQSIELLCLEMMDRLDLNFAAFDLILTPDNRYVFLELNPNGQWLWIEQLTGLPISRAIADLLVSGVKEN